MLTERVEDFFFARKNRSGIGKPGAKRAGAFGHRAEKVTIAGGEGW